ncbi:sensor histidine kinase [Conexibacter woesei]|uniref:sensor histidine kinase n=1 Tax=Conexibacter woesei TaxID=191495 RepID=UPI00041DF1CD|nr:histidine kinase [Conexibacter woesei]
MSLQDPQRRPAELLGYIAEGTAGAVGDAFFQSLVKHVAQAFAAEVAFVAEVVPEDPERARFLACWEGAGLAEPVEYCLAGTPCAEVGSADLVAYAEGVIERFPEDEMVVELGLDSYLAVAMRGSDGAHLGHLGVLASAGLRPDDDRVHALRIFAARAAAEVERRRHQQALAASRARIIEAGDAERRRIERNLHDGAQQRLVALALQLRLAEAALPGDADGAAAILARASGELAEAMGELQALARGIHPAVLTDRGLAAALEALAIRATVPVEVVAVPDRRLPEPVEATVYFAVAEALTNVAKYAQATHATVGVTLREDIAAVGFEVRDDGIGGADPSGGSGLHGLQDRIAAHGGTLRVVSEPGAGTLVAGALPL